MAEETKNLMVARGEKSVWDKPGLAATLTACDRDRWLAATVGSVLAMIGARRRGFGGGLLTITGAALAVRAAMGAQDVRVARTWFDRTMKERGWRHEDVVMQASDDSFPASDSPSWTATAGARTDTVKR